MIPEPSLNQHDESLFHFLVESVQDYAIFALDPDGSVISWNRGANRIKGYDPAEIIGRHFSLFYTPDDRSAGKPEKLLATALSEGRVEDEGWRVRKDGSRFWADVVISALYAPDGRHLGFAKVTRDLSERRAGEFALRKRERQLLDTQALAGLGSWEWDVGQDRVTWTDELFHIYGLDPQRFEATFDAYLALIHPEDRERVRRTVETAYTGATELDFEERIVRPDGEVRVLRSRARVVRDEAGEVTHMVGACLDITKLRRAEERSLQLAREQAAREAAEAAATGLRFLVEASEILASSLDYRATLRTVAELAVPEIADWCAVDLVRSGERLERVAVAHPDPRRVELARRFMELYPPLRDTPGGPWRVIDTGDPAFYPEVTDEMLAAGTVDERQLGMLRELGLRSVVIVPLVGRSEALGTLTLVQAESGRRISERDVSLAQELGRHAALAIENARLLTELEEQYDQLGHQSSELEHQAEELQEQALQTEELMAVLESTNAQLERRTEEAEQANRAKSDFLATMSHELRTPLNAIFGYADLIQMGLHGPVTDAQEEALERIKRNQRALLVLINDVLNFAKLEAGRLEIRVASVALCDVITDLDKVIAPQLDAKGLTYTCGPCDDDLRISGDRERIEQILLNLLTNAVKFTATGGRIAMEVEELAGSVRITVSDTGRGIPSDRLQAIFDPFVQIDRHPGDSAEGGVGLGLAISRDLATAMGGSLQVRSAVGQGSAFTLELPRAGEG